VGPRERGSTSTTDFNHAQTERCPCHLLPPPSPPAAFARSACCSECRAHHAGSVTGICVLNCDLLLSVLALCSAPVFSVCETLRYSFLDGRLEGAYDTHLILDEHWFLSWNPFAWEGGGRDVFPWYVAVFGAPSLPLLCCSWLPVRVDTSAFAAHLAAPVLEDVMCGMPWTSDRCGNARLSGKQGSTARNGSMGV
jgi:hypothetical protein